MEAKTDKGYVILSRSILDSPIMNKPPDYLKTWIYLLGKARHKSNGRLERGQGFTSLSEIADVLSYYVGYRKVVPSKKQIWGIIEWLRNPYEGNSEGNTIEPMIVTTKVTHGFVYTVCKYDVYQTPELYEGNSEGKIKDDTKERRKESGGNNKYKNDKNVKNDTIDIVDIETFFEKAWKLYPKKEGKGSVSKTQKKKLYELGDEFIRCIERYVQKRVGEDHKYTQMGSTFFNSGYVDYLDVNYEQTGYSQPTLFTPTGEVDNNRPMKPQSVKYQSRE